MGVGINKMELFLDKPDKKYEKSFKDYVLAYKKGDDHYYFNKYKMGLEDFHEYIKCLHNYSKGIDLQQGYVQTSSFWLIHSDEVVGVARVRHENQEFSGHIGYDVAPCYRNKGYGSEILKLALKEAYKIGIKEAIVTCNIENIASKKIIEKQNGKLLETIFDKEENEHLYKYSVETNCN